MIASLDYYSRTSICDQCDALGRSRSTAIACSGPWRYDVSAVNAVPGDSGYDDPQPDDQRNNVMLKIHWSHTRHRRIIQDARSVVRITMPRRLQRGRNR